MPSALNEILAPILTDLAVNKSETGSFFGDADESKAAQEELQRRGINYSYGGDSTLGSLILPFRREVISPEQDKQIGGPFYEGGKKSYLVQNIPAEYGKPEFGMEYIPVVRGARSALNAARDLLFGDAKEQASVVRSALGMAEGLAQYTTEQVNAAASGGQYYDPEQQRIVSFDPTAVMIGGNPATATGKVLGSGVRLPSGGKKRAYEQYGGNLDDAREKLGITQEGTDAWRSTRKGFKSEIPQEIREAAQKVYDGDMDIREYNDIVQRVLPPEPIGQVLEVPSYEEIAMALGKGEKTGGIIGVNVTLPDGTPASSRLDIPAYENQGTWVATVHDAGTSGTVLGYGPTAVLNNVSFNSKPNVALDIARGAKTKSTIGRMEGAWENRDPKIVEQQVRSILDGTAPDADQWIEVGMNPARGSGFYDKRNGQRLGEAEQILQIGPVVLAKRATRIELDDPRNLLTTRGQPKLNDQGEQMFFAGDNRVAGSGAISALSSAERARKAEEQGFKGGLYHAGVTDIDEFDLSRATPESHMGRGIYTTTGVQDANVNYANLSGPDLKNKLLSRSERIQDDLELTDEMAIREGYADANEMSWDMARKELAENQGVVYPLMGRSEKPFDISEGNDTYLKFEYPESDPKEFLDEAGGDMELARELALEDSFNYEPEGELADFLYSIRRNLDSNEYEKVSESILNAVERTDGGISGKELEEIFRNAEIYAEDDLGRLTQNEIFRQGIEDAGFDSIIHDADIFNMRNTKGEKHQIFFKPNQLRSPYAEFDPDKMYSGNLLYSGGGNTGNRIATVSALREQFNISDEGFDPRFDKRVQERDRILNTELVYDNRNFEKPELSIFDFEGRPFALTMSDRTKAGSQLRGVEGIEYDIPIDLQGGQDFMFANPLGREGQVWAQDQGATSGYLNALKLGGRRFNNDEVLMLPYRMAPTGGDFATMTAEVMVTHARHAVPKTMKTKADKKIKGFYPSWKGIDNPESIKQISEMSGNTRKKILNVLDIGLRNEGGLGIGQARLAVSDRMQFNAPDMGLQNVGFLNPLGGRFEVSGHRTYDQGLAGRGGGVLREQDINAFELLPEFAQERGFNSVDDLLRADPSTMSEEQYTLRRRKPIGIITEDILRGIEQRRN